MHKLFVQHEKMDTNKTPSIKVQNAIRVFSTIVEVIDTHEKFKSIAGQRMHLVFDNCFVCRGKVFPDEVENQYASTGALLADVVVKHAESNFATDKRTQLEEIVHFVETLDEPIVNRLTDNKLVIMYNNATVVAEISFANRTINYWMCDGVRFVLPSDVPVTDADTEEMITSVKAQASNNFADGPVTMNIVYDDEDAVISDNGVAE